MKTALKLIAALWLSASVAAPAHASRVPDLVTGKVTALPGGAQLVVNGKTYYLRLDGNALEELQSVHVGDTVDLVLDGPPQGSTTKVVAINEHTS
jgi:hypothetical protein